MDSIHRPSRQHHYQFAHRALPAIIEGDNDALEMLMTPHAKVFLNQFWDFVGSKVSPEEMVPPTGLAWSLHEFETYVIIVITMPKAERSPEAHFIGIVVGPFTEPRESEDEPIPYRYFTLELSFSVVNGEIGTVMAEWSNGSHLNYGAGPEPAEEAFVKAVQAFLLDR